MALQKITYADKVALQENATIADINKVNASDMNEIKTVFNAMVDAFGTLPKVINNLTSTSTTDALSAYQGKLLLDRLVTLETKVNNMQTVVNKLNTNLGDLTIEKEFTKNVNVSVANTWYDTGITGSDLETGTYIMEVFTNSYGVNKQYSERMSGVVAWYHSGTNDSSTNEIPLSKAGHARNSHDIRFRIARSPSAESPNTIRLQVSDTIAWSGAGTFTIKFRKII